MRKKAELDPTKPETSHVACHSHLLHCEAIIPFSAAVGIDSLSHRAEHISIMISNQQLSKSDIFGMHCPLFESWLKATVRSEQSGYSGKGHLGLLPTRYSKLCHVWWTYCNILKHEISHCCIWFLIMEIHYRNELFLFVVHLYIHWKSSSEGQYLTINVLWHPFFLTAKVWTLYVGSFTFSHVITDANKCFDWVKSGNLCANLNLSMINTTTKRDTNCTNDASPELLFTQFMESSLFLAIRQPILHHILLASAFLTVPSSVFRSKSLVPYILRNKNCQVFRIWENIRTLPY